MALPFSATLKVCICLSPLLLAILAGPLIFLRHAAVTEAAVAVVAQIQATHFLSAVLARQQMLLSMVFAEHDLDMALMRPPWFLCQS